jgi:hypothetical protein
MTSLKQVNADEYKYIVLRVKTDRTSVSSSTSAIFYACGNTMGAVGGQTVWYEIPKGDQWNWIIIDMNKKPGWAGKINNLRLDIFDGPMIDKGLSVTYSVLAFAKTKEDAQKLTEGYIPEGCIADFGSFKQKLVDVHNVKKALDTMHKDAAALFASGTSALDAAKALENANEKTPAIYAEAAALLDKVKAGLDAIDAAKASAQALTNEVDDAKALGAQANEALTALQADAEALTAKLEELAQVAAETELPTTQEPTTEAPTTEPAPAQKSGCKSLVGAGMIAMVMLLGAAFVGRKRD